jgi:hypothetical protein
MADKILTQEFSLRTRVKALTKKLSDFFSVGNRATRLGEFSPTRRLFTLDFFITEAAKISTELFFPRSKLVIYFDKNRLASILGSFFHQLIWQPFTFAFHKSDKPKRNNNKNQTSLTKCVDASAAMFCK